MCIRDRLMAVGKCFDVRLDPSGTDASINGHPVVRGGRRLDFDDDAVRATLAAERHLEIDRFMAPPASTPRPYTRSRHARSAPAPTPPSRSAPAYVRGST